jgi:hypothetical protein
MKTRHESTTTTLGRALPLCGALLAPLGCGAAPDDATGSVIQAAQGPFLVSGTIVDANSNPLRGVTVTLSGSAQATAITGPDGAYAFSGLARAAYSLLPTLTGCSFVPAAVDFSKLKSNTTLHFAGSGPSCGGTPSDGGATSGSLTISGTVADSSGNPVPGARIVLSGTAQAVRTTGASGAYSFSVDAGSYVVTPAGSCTYTPTAANLNGVTKKKNTQNFVRTGCPAPLDPCEQDTISCLTSRETAPGSCYRCVVDAGCFDHSFSGATCEDVTGTAPACQSALAAPSAPTETQVCLATLKSMFSSHCASTLEEVPCLCGATPPDTCQTGVETPAGPVYPFYQCDLGPSIEQILTHFTLPRFGASVANAIIQCAQAFGCSCLY